MLGSWMLAVSVFVSHWFLRRYVETDTFLCVTISSQMPLMDWYFYVTQLELWPDMSLSRLCDVTHLISCVIKLFPELHIHNMHVTTPEVSVFPVYAHKSNFYVQSQFSLSPIIIHCPIVRDRGSHFASYRRSSSRLVHLPYITSIFGTCKVRYTC
jgi:hypothetical protein